MGVKALSETTAELSYREPMRVLSVRVFSAEPDLLSYPVCPRCHCTMEREYQSYCDRCGQALSWDFFERASVIL